MASTSPLPNRRILEIELALDIRKAIESKEVDITSAMSVIRKGMQLMNQYKSLPGSDKKEILISVLTHIAAGKDGILGTDDDLLPKETVQILQTMLQSSVIDDVVNTLSGFIKTASIMVPQASPFLSKLSGLLSGLLSCVSSMRH